MRDPGPAPVAARSPGDLGAVADAVRDFRFPLPPLRVDPRSRTLTVPYEKKHPRPESWELLVRGAREVTVKGRLEQETDYFRGLRHDAAAGVLEIEGVLVKVRVRVDSLDVVARCTRFEAAPDYDVADLPAGVRREIEVRESASLRGRERYRRSDRERVVAVTVAAALAAVVLAAGCAVPLPVLLLEGAVGGAAGFVLARRNIGFYAAGAAIFGAPVIAVSWIGILATRGLTDGPGGGAVHALFWSLMAVAGLLLALLNRKFMDENQGLVSLWDAAAAPPKPLDRGIPPRAAAMVGLGAALVLAIFRAPWTCWALAAPLGSGGTAWILARFQVRPLVAGRVLLAVGAVVGFVAVEGGAFVPAALLLGAAHFPAGMMVSYYARGEGPR